MNSPSGPLGLCQCLMFVSTTHVRRESKSVANFRNKTQIFTNTNTHKEFTPNIRVKIQRVETMIGATSALILQLSESTVVLFS